MAFINDRVFDAALQIIIGEANELWVLPSEQTTYDGANAAKIGVKAGPVITGPADGSPNGRAVTVGAITDGDVTLSGTATHFALVDTVNSRLLVYGALTGSVVVNAGNKFSLTSFTIRIPDAA